MGLLVDIFILVIAIGIGLIGAPVVVKKLLAMSPKRKAIEAARQQEELGEVNTIEFNLAQLRHCDICGKQTDPRKDLRTGEIWVHVDCYLKKLDSYKKGSA